MSPEAPPPVEKTEPVASGEGVERAKTPGEISSPIEQLEGVPSWASRLAELYFSGTTAMFALHGNVFDPVGTGEGEDNRYQNLSGFLAEQLFGRWDLVLRYDLARGLKVHAGQDETRLREMVELANRRIGDLASIPRDPSKVLAVLDAFVRKNLMSDQQDRLSVAILIEHACYIVPNGEPGRLSLSTSTNLVTLLNWASSPYVKQLNMAFVLVEEKLASLNDRLTGNPHVGTLEIPLPEVEERERFIRFRVGKEPIEQFSDYKVVDLAKLTAGISLTDLRTLIESAREAGRRLDEELFRSLKKRLLERQAQGFLEFIEPTWNLDMVVGHVAAKARLRQDGELLKRGLLEAMPMGYLLCGSVGTGKSFLAQCATGTFGIPCVMLKNFRSKYVGETEGNLERILSVLRAMGPVVVIIDEADAALGDRDSGGDSGTSSRVFAMIAAQMGNTRYRGRILWMLLTCRPDLLPIDLKRQGRAEVHIPLFYPQTGDEIRDMFLVMARKLGAKLALEDVPTLSEGGRFSGADIEGIVGRAWRVSLLAGTDTISKEALAEAADRFMPAAGGLERELQETAAVIECTDQQYLPEAISKRLEEAGGKGQLQKRLTALKQMVETL